MAGKETKSSSEEIKLVEEINTETAPTEQPLLLKGSDGGGGGRGGWGGWGFSLFSYLSDLQKVAAVAAEEISCNAMKVAKTVAKGIAEIQTVEDSESSKEADAKASAVEEESEDESERKAALDKLEKGSEESFVGQGLKVLDNKVETFASGAWQALGNAWKGSSTLVQQYGHMC